MSQLLKYNFYNFLTIAVLLCSSCNKSSLNQDPEEIARNANEVKFDNKAENSAQYIVEAYSHGMFEMALAQQAKAKSKNQDVKSLAQSIIAGYTKVNGEIEKIAEEKQISLPGALSAAQVGTLQNAEGKEGEEYDLFFTDKLVSAHENAVKLFEKAANNDDTDADLRNFFLSSLPEIKHYLMMGTIVKDEIK